MSPDGRIEDWKLGFVGADQKFVTHNGCFITHGTQVAVSAVLTEQVIKLPTLSPRSVQLAFLLVVSEISPRIVLNLFPLKISQFKSKPDQNLESHGGCCSCTLKKWLLKEFGSAMTGSHRCWVSTSNLSLAPAISEQSHLMVSVCDTHRYLLPHAGPPWCLSYMPSAGLPGWDLCWGEAQPPLSCLPCRTAGRHGAGLLQGKAHAPA